MKKIYSLIIIYLMVFLFTACTIKDGNTDAAKESAEKTSKFTGEEISSAMSCVKINFKEYKGCTLTNLWYDETQSDYFIKDYFDSENGTIRDINPENAIVLLCDFDVDSSGGDGSLNPNSTYYKYNWILTRESKNSDWKVVDRGY